MTVDSELYGVRGAELQEPEKEEEYLKTAAPAVSWPSVHPHQLVIAR